MPTTGPIAANGQLGHPPTGTGEVHQKCSCSTGNRFHLA